MERWKVTYLPKDESNKPLGPYIDTGVNSDQVISKVVQRIISEHPGINLERDYNPWPLTELVTYSNDD
jgi:hypothetical protein